MTGETVGLLLAASAVCMACFLLSRLKQRVSFVFPASEGVPVVSGKDSKSIPHSPPFRGGTSPHDENTSGLRRRLRSATPVRRSAVAAVSTPVPPPPLGAIAGSAARHLRGGPALSALAPAAAPHRHTGTQRSQGSRALEVAAALSPRPPGLVGLRALLTPRKTAAAVASAVAAAAGRGAEVGAKRVAEAAPARVDESGWHLLCETVQASRIAFEEQRRWSALNSHAPLQVPSSDVLTSLLRDLGLRRIDVPGDGDCLFHAVVYGLTQCPERASVEAMSAYTVSTFNELGQAVALRSRDVRMLCVRWVETHIDHPVVAGLTPRQLIASSYGGMAAETYLNNMSKDQWGDELMVVALASGFQVNLVIFPNRKDGEVVCVPPVKLDEHFNVVTGMDFPDVCIGHLYDTHYVACTAQAD